MQAQRQREVDKVLGERDDGVTEIPLVESRSEVLQAALGRIRRNMKESLENEKELEGQRRGLIFDANWRAELKLYGMLEETMRRGRALYVLVSAADMFRASSGSTEGASTTQRGSRRRFPRSRTWPRAVASRGLKSSRGTSSSMARMRCRWPLAWRSSANGLRRVSPVPLVPPSTSPGRASSWIRTATGSPLTPEALERIKRRLIMLHPNPLQATPRARCSPHSHARPPGWSTSAPTGRVALYNPGPSRWRPHHHIR